MKQIAADAANLDESHETWQRHEERTKRELSRQGLLIRRVAIDLDALARVRDAVQVPLVLHGGTGIPPEQIPPSVRLGVAKINFGTALKQVYLATLQEALARYREPLSPHGFVGRGGAQDVLMAGREAVKLKARELMTQCGSVGKAG